MSPAQAAPDLALVPGGMIDLRMCIDLPSMTHQACAVGHFDAGASCNHLLHDDKSMAQQAYV